MINDTKFAEIEPVTNDRILKLKPMDGKIAKGHILDATFRGDNNFKAVTNGTLWEFKFDQGALPEALKQRWTSFGKAKRYAEEYFRKKNIEIVEII